MSIRIIRNISNEENIDMVIGEIVNKKILKNQILK